MISFILAAALMTGQPDRKVDPPTVPIDKKEVKKEKFNDRWDAWFHKQSGKLYVVGKVEVPRGYKLRLLPVKSAKSDPKILVLNYVLDKMDTKDRKLEGERRTTVRFSIPDYKAGQYDKVTLVYRDGYRHTIEIDNGE